MAISWLYADRWDWVLYTQIRLSTVERKGTLFEMSGGHLSKQKDLSVLFMAVSYVRWMDHSLSTATWSHNMNVDRTDAHVQL